MKLHQVITLALMAVSTGSVAGVPVMMDSTTGQKLDTLLTISAMTPADAGPGERQASISDAFLGTPYRAGTLIGSVSQNEMLVVNFNAVDCLTLLEYLHALSHSADRESFLQNLIATRYKNGQVAFAQRKHFFSDWYSSAPQNAVDITASLSTNTLSVTKNLNQKDDGTAWLPGVPVVARTITWLPTAQVDDQALNRIQDGDLIGIYTPKGGLDVTHAGIAIHKNGKVWFRNASFLSRNMKVVDTPLRSYLQRYPGIVVLRPR